MNSTTTLVDETGREFTPVDVVGRTARIVTEAHTHPGELIRGYGNGLLIVEHRMGRVAYRNYVDISGLKPGSKLYDDIPPMPTMTVSVADRGTTRSYEGVRVVTVPIVAMCPRCGGPRGTAQPKRFPEDGEYYSVDTWNNPCGHVDVYSSVLVEAGVHLPKHLRDAA